MTNAIDEYVINEIRFGADICFGQEYWGQGYAWGHRERQEGPTSVEEDTTRTCYTTYEYYHENEIQELSDFYDQCD
ncbi:hypothetical protein CQA88_31535 [Klebsiella pneumoniae]|nr:hypothetical protein CQA88_31535 [Klebsiella pneumoniae]